MEKKDYDVLRNKYSIVQDREELYRKELITFIDEAFEKHGNEFEFKCDTHESWQAKSEDDEDDFDVMSDLPCYLTIDVNDDNSHEIYPYRIYKRIYAGGYYDILVDGWDYREAEWGKYFVARTDITSLQDIAYFINACLEQEAEAASE